MSNDTNSSLMENSFRVMISTITSGVVIVGALERKNSPRELNSVRVDPATRYVLVKPRRLDPG